MGDSQNSLSPGPIKVGSAMKIKAKFSNNRFITEKKPNFSA